MRIERLRQQLDFDLQWTAFPLHPETPQQGRLLSDLFAAHPGYMESMWPRLKAAAAELDLKFGERTETFNSRAASELACWAAEQNRAWPFHLAAYEAYFVHGKNLALPQVLKEITEQAGLPPEDVQLIIDERRYADQVDQDWARCAHRGVRAVPTIDDGKRQLVGFQSDAAMAEFLRG